MLGIRLLFVVSMSLVTLSQAKSDCGIQNSGFLAKIPKSKNEVVPNHRYPWMAFLVLTYYQKNGMLSGNTCGATLINDQWLVSSATCLSIANDKFFITGVAMLGTNDWSGNHISKHNIKINFDSRDVFINDDYNVDTNKNDIALVRLPKPLDLKKVEKYVRPICLPQSNRPGPEDKCIVTGWGQTSPFSMASKKLIQINETIVTDNCQDGKICAQTTPGHPLCFGDYGGPLQCRKESKDPWTIYGIIPYGNGVCEQLSAFTDVTKYLGWIEDIMDYN